VRVACLLYLAPGSAGEYRERHKTVWPEFEAEMAAAGARNHSVFQSGETLVEYFEVDDYEGYSRAMAQSPLAARWEKQFADILRYEVDPKTRMPVTMFEVWHQP
jgi:L-rhamnose mutarotase